MLSLGQKVNLKKEKGAVLLLAVMLMVVFSLLTVTLFDMLKSSIQISGNHRMDLRAIYAADAGAEDAIDRLRQDPTLADDEDETFTGTGAYGSYTVTIEDAEVSNSVTYYREKDITSVGTAFGYQRTLEVHVKIRKGGTPESPEYTVRVSSWKLIGS